MVDEVIVVEDLTKIYDLGEVRVEALRGVTLRLQRGAFVAIMGSSGSGKSTLMNILGCLDHPTSGRYLLEGIDVANLGKEHLADIRNRKLGFVFQNFHLLARTSARENVALPLLYRAIPARQRHIRALEVLREVGLADRAAHLPNQLSGGQMQRVAIARALVNRPTILLADEPTGNLDSQTSTDIMALLQRLNHDQGITVIVVTHEADIAQYAERVLVFKDGLIIDDHLVSNRTVATPSQQA